MYMRGLGDWMSWMEQFTGKMQGSAFGMDTGGKGGSGSGGASSSSSNTNTVTTAVNTQVSPQISPVFVQQSSPSNSPVNADPRMVSVPQPTYMPVTGAIPGFDYASGYDPTGLASRGLSVAGISPLAIGIVAALGIGVAVLTKKRKGRK